MYALPTQRDPFCGRIGILNLKRTTSDVEVRGTVKLSLSPSPAPQRFLAKWLQGDYGRTAISSSASIGRAPQTHNHRHAKQ